VVRGVAEKVNVPWALNYPITKRNALEAIVKFFEQPHYLALDI
jgi:hypothetical protein